MEVLAVVLVEQQIGLRSAVLVLMEKVRLEQLTKQVLAAPKVV